MLKPHASAKLAEIKFHHPRSAALIRIGREREVFAAMAVSETDLATSAAKVTVAQTFTPKREHRGIYDDAFGRFTATYAAQKKIFRNFNAHRPE